MLGAGEYLEQNTMGKESLPLSFPNSFLPLPVSTKTYTTMLCGGKKENLLPYLCWKLENARPLYSSVRNSNFFPPFSVYWAQRLHFVSLWIWTVSICQHVSFYFLLLKKRKKNLKWNYRRSAKGRFEIPGWVKWALWQHGFSFSMFNCDV